MKFYSPTHFSPALSAIKMIITEYHIELYKLVGGDVDHLQRIRTPEEKSLINQDIIVQVEEIVADLELVKKCALMVIVLFFLFTLMP